MPTDETQHSTDVQHALQQAVVAVYQRHRGASVADTRAALEAHIDELGLDPQPPGWLDATATDLAGGRRVVLSPLEDEPTV